MKNIFEAAQQIQDYFDLQNWQFCFIGGIALLELYFSATSTISRT